MGEVAVNHFSDWTHWNWLLWTVALFAAGALSLFALAFALAGSETERSHGDGLMFFAGAFLIAVVSFLGFTTALINITRHLPGFNWVFLTTIAAVGVTAFAQYRLVKAAVVGHYVGTVNPWLWRYAAIGAAVSGLIAIGYDGLNRVAAWFPTTVVVVSMALVGVVFYAMSPQRASR